MQILRQFIGDPWFVAMLITLAITGVVLLWALRPYLRDLIVLAMALPPAIFKKTFGDPPEH